MSQKNYSEVASNIKLKSDTYILWFLPQTKGAYIFHAGWLKHSFPIGDDLYYPEFYFDQSDALVRLLGPCSDGHVVCQGPKEDLDKIVESSVPVK